MFYPGWSSFPQGGTPDRTEFPLGGAISPGWGSFLLGGACFPLDGAVLLWAEHQTEQDFLHSGIYFPLVGAVFLQMEHQTEWVSPGENWFFTPF